MALVDLQKMTHKPFKTEFWPEGSVSRAEYRHIMARANEALMSLLLGTNHDQLKIYVDRLDKYQANRETVRERWAARVLSRSISKPVATPRGRL